MLLLSSFFFFFFNIFQVFRNKLDFFAAAKVSSSFPPLVLPEIAFAGNLIMQIKSVYAYMFIIIIIIILIVCCLDP
jgi:hypothetical protein